MRPVRPRALHFGAAAFETALRCYEAAAKGCHLTIVAHMLRERLPIEVEAV